MPYVTNTAREQLDMQVEPNDAGQLNYVLTREVDQYLANKGVRYANINEVIGVLECMKLELYRRVAAPYEDVKCEENGDVYDSIG